MLKSDLNNYKINYRVYDWHVCAYESKNIILIVGIVINTKDELRSSRVRSSR